MFTNDYHVALNSQSKMRPWILRQQGSETSLQIILLKEQINHIEETGSAHEHYELYKDSKADGIISHSIADERTCSGKSETVSGKANN